MLKTTLLAAALAALPGLAAAMGCSYGERRTDTAQSCAPGHVINADSGLCEPEVTG